MALLALGELSPATTQRSAEESCCCGAWGRDVAKSRNPGVDLYCLSLVWLSRRVCPDSLCRPRKSGNRSGLLSRLIVLRTRHPNLDVAVLDGWSALIDRVSLHHLVIHPRSRRQVFNIDASTMLQKNP